MFAANKGAKNFEPKIANTAEYVSFRVVPMG